MKNYLIENNNLTFKGKNFIILISIIILYFINTFFLNSLNPFFPNYFNDLLATILLFSFLNTILPIKLVNYKIIILITIIAIFFWEYVALYIKAGSVFDWWDVIAYIFSMLIYMTLLKLLVKE
jgi:hypothetical protein